MKSKGYKLNIIAWRSLENLLKTQRQSQYLAALYFGTYCNVKFEVGHVITSSLYLVYFADLFPPKYSYFRLAPISFIGLVSDLYNGHWLKFDLTQRLSSFNIPPSPWMSVHTNVYRSNPKQVDYFFGGITDYCRFSRYNVVDWSHDLYRPRTVQ